MSNIVIVGSGITGLIASLLLRNKYPNKNIIILEKDTEIGGLLKSYKYENLNLSDMKFNNVGTTSTNSTHFKKIFKTILTFIYIQIPNFEIQKKLKDFYMSD